MQSVNALLVVSRRVTVGRYSYDRRSVIALQVVGIRLQVVGRNMWTDEYCHFERDTEKGQLRIQVTVTRMSGGQQTYNRQSVVA